MAYTVNSAKDSSGQEHLYMELFNRLAPQIIAYKKQHGGDLEGAFQKITGTPWPEGRSVKLNDGVPEMTKDRTFKSVLGKYIAAPAAIGATALFAPAALPAVAKAVGGAAMKGGAGALAARMGSGAVPGLIQGDWKGALKGAAGGAVAPGFGGSSVGGSVMRDMLTKAGSGALQGGIQGGWKGAVTGAAGGTTQAIPGNIGKILGATGQSNVGGDIMAKIMNRGPNESFSPTEDLANRAKQAIQTGNRPQGW